VVCRKILKGHLLTAVFHPKAFVLQIFNHHVVVFLDQLDQVIELGLALQQLLALFGWVQLTILQLLSSLCESKSFEVNLIVQLFGAKLPLNQVAIIEISLTAHRIHIKNLCQII
jgi:hypothetical protein